MRYHTEKSESCSYPTNIAGHRVLTPLPGGPFINYVYTGGDKKADINKGGCVDSVPNKDKGEKIQIPGAGDRQMSKDLG